MSVTLWNAIITVGISVTSLMIASAMCMYYYTLYKYMYVHMLSSHVLYSVWNVERSWPGFENEGREKEMAEKHAMSRPGCISKHQELVRQISEGHSTMT